MITKEQFITLIEVTKSSMDYDFLEKNKFVIIDKDMQHAKTIFVFITIEQPKLIRNIRV